MVRASWSSDGRRIRGRGLRRPLPNGLGPEFGVYLLARDPGPVDWEHRWVRWPDFRIPSSTDDAMAALNEVYERAGTQRVEVAAGSSALDEPTRASLQWSVDEADQLLRSQDAVALGHQFPDFSPVDVDVEHHADDGRAPVRAEEGVTRAREGIELRSRRPKGQDGDWARGVVDRQDMREGPPPDPPPRAGPRLLLLDLRQPETH
jgi:hypothetical protein